MVYKIEILYAESVFHLPKTYQCMSEVQIIKVKKDN